MKFTSAIQSFRSLLNKEFEKSKPGFAEFGAVQMAISEVPKIFEKRGTEYVQWGEYNDWPQQIRKLKYSSGIHNAIITTATDMISGDGFLINGATTPEQSLAAYNSLSAESKAIYDQFVNNPHGDEELSEVLVELGGDAKELGGVAYEVILNTEFDKVAAIKYLDIANVRASKMKDGKVCSYAYSRDWSKFKQADFKPRELPLFNPKNLNKETANQIIYIKRGKQEYYPEPDWVGCLTWTQIDGQMGVFHLANIENGMNPSLWWRFFKKPGSENEQQRILDDLRKNYKGAGKAGKHIVTFSEGKELAPEITPINVSNLDKQQIVLSELCNQQILTGHKLTSPLLAGIATKGQLGGNTELEKAYQIYDKTRMKPYRNMIVKSFQRILDFNKCGVKISINPFNPFV